MKSSDSLQKLWEKQASALRNPHEIWSNATPESLGITKQTLSFKADENIISLLQKSNISLLVSREYENLIVQLYVENDQLKQSWFPLPHPSGIAIHPSKNTIYIASTRNPNRIVEFRQNETGFWFPSRTKFYPGHYYLHDLAFIKNELFANAVGINAVIKADINTPDPESPVWFPECVENPDGACQTEANYIQLNSIAAGNDLAHSYFSASGSEILKRRPGHINYPVDKRGVIFSGKSRKPIVTGLTRPHSARLHNEVLWVNNSGYGQTGYIHHNQFIPLAGFPGWTRGLAFFDNIAFVGVSRILPRFRKYAPGLKDEHHSCGIFAIDIQTGETLGQVRFPFGNQIFGVEILEQTSNPAFQPLKIR